MISLPFKTSILTLIAASAFVCAPAANPRKSHADAPSRKEAPMRHKPSKKKNAELYITDPEFFHSPEALRIARQVLLYQRVTGGWPKNIDMTHELSPAEQADILAERERRDDSTTDNNATWLQMRYLAHVYQATADTTFRSAFLRGVEFLASGQYPGGGWPQFWPDPKGYQVHITYNDGAMAGTMLLFRDIAKGEYPFNGTLTTPELRSRLSDAFAKGVECILATQIRVDGKPTVWCQQHDRTTLLPAKARSYELPSYCSAESAQLVGLLMDLPNPTPEVKAAIHGAMKWFDSHKITGVKVKYNPNSAGERGFDITVEADQTASPLWTRYYDLEKEAPYFCDRDGIIRRHLDEIGYERRTGYSWFNSHPAELYPKYEKWATKHDPKNRVSISLSTPGRFNADTLIKK